MAIPPRTASDVRFKKPSEELLSTLNRGQKPPLESEDGIVDMADGVGVGKGVGNAVGVGLANPMIGICPLHIGIGVDAPG